jgi:hypothetical protein
MRMRVCYLDCHKAELCCYLRVHIETYYVNYSCFTSICDIFTDSPSYIFILKPSSHKENTILFRAFIDILMEFDTGHIS